MNQKLQINLSTAGSDDEWKELPCLQIRVEFVTKAHQPPLNVLLQNAKFPQFQWYRTTHCFCFRCTWHHIDLTFAGSLPSAGTCRAMWTFSLCCCIWPLLFELAPFPGLPIYRSLDCLLIFHGSEGSNDIVLCTI